ncbi:ADP-ribosyltransferase [Streptomyces sp. NPDC056907]|uniref:ADP-ribosyltransferase n=1 Tax=Streptomyces sp. NPDC056907 TaxID=3345962 RepID=UPI00368BE7D0
MAVQADLPARRWELPRSLVVTRVLLYLMFALTLLGGVGVVNSLLELGTHVTPMLSLVALYAVVPGIVAMVLARLVWTGGKVVWFALVGLQAWLLVGSVVNLYGGSERGLSQLLLPGALLALVSAGASRAWFELPADQRAVRPRWTRERLRREAFPSIPYMIGWRRNRGQGTVEYVGMISLVALIIGALVFSGVGTQVATGLQTAVCNILGGDCESDTVAGGGGGESGGGASGGGDSGGGDSGGSDNGGGDSGGGDSDGGNNGGGDSGGGSDGGGSNGGSDGGGSNGGSDGGGSDGGGSNGGGSDGGSDGGGSDGGGSNGGGSNGGGSDGGSDGGGSNGGGSNGGSDGGGSDGGGSDGGGSNGGGSNGGGSDGGGSNGGGDSGGGSDGGGSDGGGSDGGGDSGGGSDGGGSDGGSDSGGSSGGVECNPVMAPWGIMQSCRETGTGGSDAGGGTGGGGSSGGGSDGGGSDGGGSDGGSDGGGSDGGGSDGGGDSGGGSDGGSDSGGSSGGVECNPVMAPWGIMQSCRETGTSGGTSGGTGGSSGGKNDDKNDDKNEDNDNDEDKDDKNDCLNATKVAFSGPASTGSAGDGRYTLASAAGRTRVVVGGVALAADSGGASAMDAAQALSGYSLAGVDTYQDVEDRLSHALGLTDEPRPEPEPERDPEPEPEPEPEPGPDGGSCSDRPDPMTALDDVPKYRNGDRKKWSEEVEKKADENPLTKDLTAEDALIIADYTGPWAEDANKYLRGQPISGLRAGRVPEFIEKMDRALEHLPPVNGTFYRGTFMPDELMERFANGEEVEMPEYLSTSSDPAKADRAAENAKANGRKGENVVMEVTTDNGRNIDPLSRYHGRESEVLIPRGGKFVKTGETTKIIGGKEYKVIQVKQVG